MRFLSTTLAVLASAQLVGAAEVTFRDEATVTAGSLVRLSDVATVIGADAERVARTPLMPSPAPGASQHLAAGAVRDMLAAQGESPSRHRFRGAYRIHVSTPSNVPAAVAQPTDWRTASPSQPSVAGASTAFRVRTSPVNTSPSPARTPVVQRVGVREAKAVEAAVAEALQRTIDALQGEPTGRARIAVRGVKLSAAALREMLDVPSESLVASLVGPAAPAPGDRQARVVVATRNDGEAFSVVAELVAQPMRVVVTVPLNRGALITASAVQVEPTPIDEIGTGPSAGYSAIDDVVGREASRPLRIGDTLSDANTAPPLMVHRGEEVSVVSAGGGVSVRMLAVSKSDGRVGELVTVEMLDRRETLMARVVGPRQLAVLSSGLAAAGLNGTGGF